eukprot:6176393-Pyramimonas_sp.AAC.1
MVQRKALPTLPDDGGPRAHLHDDGPDSTPVHWGRLVRGVLTVSKLRSFWGQLGQLLRAISQRGSALR